MADTIRRIDYFYLRVKDQPGEGFRALSALKEAGVNLLNLTAFPADGGTTQIDFVPEDSGAFVRAARKAGLAISAKKQCFYIQGKDRVGALADIFRKLADAKVNGHAANASCATGGFGMVLWVKPDQMVAAAKALGV